MKYAPAIVLICLALLFGSARAQPETVDLGLPVIRNGQAPVSSDPVLLDNGDNSFIDSAVSSNGQCVFLAYIDRDNGNRLLVRQDAGDHLIDVPLPDAPQLAVLARDFPEFTAPGEKQADGTMVIRNGVMSLYYTGRAEGDEAGKFHLWRLDIAEPQCQF